MKQQIISSAVLTGGHAASIVFFDSAPAYQVNSGVIGVTLATEVVDAVGGADIRSTHIAVAHLRATMSSAIALRDVLNKAILAAAAPNGTPS